MSLSKPLFNALSFYLEQLFMHPLRTKSITRFDIKFSIIFAWFSYQFCYLFVIFSCVLASSANVVSQKLMGHKEINQQSLLAYALFGWDFFYFWRNYAQLIKWMVFCCWLRLLFGGSMPHYFYKIMERTLVGRTKLNQFIFFACERLMYTPMFQALSLFCLSIFEVNAQFMQYVVQNSNQSKFPRLVYFCRVKAKRPLCRICIHFTGLFLKLIGHTYLCSCSSTSDSYHRL